MNRVHLIALLEACIVTFLWSSSYVLVKLGLTQMTPLNLVSLRYIVASIILVVVALMQREFTIIGDWKTLLKFIFLGLSGYSIAQGLQCVGLYYLPAVSVTFILNFTPVIVLVLSVITLGEYPSLLQVGGMLLVLLGGYLFFSSPLSVDLFGIAVTLFSGVGWALYLVSSRFFFKQKKSSPLGFTAFSMCLGTIILAVMAYSIEGITNVSLNCWIIIIWLGIINTAVAFLLWNHALQRLGAFEISILQNTMLIQIALLSWMFLGEQITFIKLISMALVFVGALIVQLK